MTTIFLPGYSIRNRDWQNDIISALPQIDFTPVSFQHWQEGIDDIEKFDYASELKLLSNHATANEPVNLLAKSIGTILAMQLLISQTSIINKTILCGLPINTLPQTVKLLSDLSKTKPQNLLVIQNINDPVGSSAEVKKLLQIHLPHAEFIETPRDDHHYPYPELISQFLS